MILIGQYDSPFVRRVGIALTLYDLPFRHETWSAFGQADLLRAHNPLTRVPTLVLDNGESLIDSHMILDYLDSLVPADRRLFPQAEPERHRALKRAALATGVGDKAVGLFYEYRMHEQASAAFVTRWGRQVGDGLQALETTLTNGPDGHAEVAIACVWRFITDALPDLVSPTRFPRLAVLSARLEATEPFRTISQPFVAPT